MKFYRYWVKVQGQILVGGALRKALCYGRSELSLEDAHNNAQEQLDAIQSRINGEKKDLEGYEVAIREEILRVIDKHNLISRNRYGAEVLNSENLMFVDIDRVFDTPMQLLKRILFGPRKISFRDKIVAMIEKQAAQPKYARFGFRIYATHSGVRVIVTGHEWPAESEQAQALLTDFRSDFLYAYLCAKQQCYRARLTPKPSRMRIKGFKVPYPRTPEEDADFTTWRVTYERESAKYAVCRFLKTIGPNSSNALVTLHDTLTKARERLPLA